MDNKQKQKIKNLTQDSGNTSWYTPIRIIEAARVLMGSIDLDPASCEAANYRVHAPFDLWNWEYEGKGCYRLANHFFTKEDDGLSKPWFGNVWMNHPYSVKGNKRWPAKLVHEYQAQRTRQACCITFASTSEQWFAPLKKFPQFYFTGRTGFEDAYGQPSNEATKGTVVTFLPPRGIRPLTAVEMLAGAYAEFEGDAKL